MRMLTSNSSATIREVSTFRSFRSRRSRNAQSIIAGLFIERGIPFAILCLHGARFRPSEAVDPHSISESTGSGPNSRPTPLFPSVYFPNAEKWIRSGP